MVKGNYYSNFGAKMNKKKQTKDLHLFEGWAFKRINYLIFGIGLLLIVGGYLVMAVGKVNSFQSITLAPIMLFFGYVIAIPFALIYRAKK